MLRELIWVHDKALNKELIVQQNPDEQSRALFIWDDNYFQNSAYSLKRLIFIYETLCQMPLTIVKADTFDLIKSLAPAKIKTFYTADTSIKQMIDKLSSIYEVEIIKPKSFVSITSSHEFKRFFTYWNSAKNTAFLMDGGQDA